MGNFSSELQREEELAQVMSNFSLVMQRAEKAGYWTDESAHSDSDYFGETSFENEVYDAKATLSRGEGRTNSRRQQRKQQAEQALTM